jgi:hypothetical protein
VAGFFYGRALLLLLLSDCTARENTGSYGIQQLVDLHDQQQLQEHDMASRKPSVPKTSADLKLQLAQAKLRLAELEKRAYAEELTELISATNIVADFAKIQARVKDIPATAILAAIGRAVRIIRVEVTQAGVVARKPVDPNKPNKPRGKKAS